MSFLFTKKGTFKNISWFEMDLNRVKSPIYLLRPSLWFYSTKNSRQTSIEFLTQNLTLCHCLEFGLVEYKESRTQNTAV